jgi:hypothetical protein
VKLLHQCPGCWSYTLHEPPEGGWVECDCGEKMDVVDLRDKKVWEAIRG